MGGIQRLHVYGHRLLDDIELTPEHYVQHHAQTMSHMSGLLPHLFAGSDGYLT